MGFAQELQKTLQKEYSGVEDKESGTDFGALYREKMIGFRKPASTVVRVERPSNIARARALGYKAKHGIIVARIRVRKGSGSHQRPSRGRRPKRMGVKKLTRRKSIQGFAEQRVARKYPNMEVLNSYWVGKDGLSHYFEVILVEPSNPSIKSDKDLKWLCKKQHRKRAFRGLTSAQKKSRGLRRKGKGAEKVRPSQRAHERKAK